MIAPQGEQVNIPFTTGLGPGLSDWRDVDDAAGAVGRIGALIKDICFVAISVIDCGWVLAAHEDAAVGIIAGPEFYAQREIAITFPGDQKRSTITRRGLNGAHLCRPVGVPENGKIIHPASAIYERDPLVIGAIGQGTG